MWCAVLTAVALLLLSPEPAWAWGPATHVYLGAGVLESLALLPPLVQDLISRHRHEYLYGCVAADISLAKKYVPEGRHCHNWTIGEEIYSAAETDRLRAVSLGYLSHLAADTVAHNTFVPRQLLLTSSTKALGHSYWEHRMDMQLGDRYMRLARSTVMDHDHSAADALFDRVLSSTLFSFRTNRRIFRGMIRFQDNDRWHAVFSRMLENSRWLLTQDEIDRYVVRSFDYTIDYLQQRGEAIAAGLDPIGDEKIGLSKKLRRMALREGNQSPDLLHELADEFFPFPEVPFGHWHNRESAGAGEPSASLEP